jgi:hypothetical protein
MTKNELINKINSTKNVIATYEYVVQSNKEALRTLEFQLKDYMNIKVGDTVNINDYSYIQVFGENGLAECGNPREGTFVVRALNCKFDVGRWGEINDTMVECNGKLYTTQKRFISKV